MKWKVVNTFNGGTEATGLCMDEAFDIADEIRLCAAVPENYVWKWNYAGSFWQWVDPN